MICREVASEDEKDDSVSKDEDISAKDRDD